MTTIDVGASDDIIDAEIVSRAAVLRQAAAAKVKAAGAGLWELTKRTERGVAASPRDLLAYWADLPGAIDVAEAAPGDPTTKAKAAHEETKRKHRANVTGVVLASLAWCTAGWTALGRTVPGPGGYAVVVVWWLVLLGVAGLASRGVWAGKHKDGWLWPSRLWGAVAIGVAALFVHLALGWSAAAMAAGWLAPVLGWLMWAASDGEVFGDGDDLEVKRSDAPTTAAATESNAVKALTKAIGEKEDRASELVTVIGTPATVGPWTVTHFQLMNHVFGDLERKTTPSPTQVIAGALRRPTGWVFPERTGDDESQGLLYVASANPWPTRPLPWPGLQQVEHDAWTAESVGVDMFTTKPWSMPVAGTSDMCGASSGGGKTAWTRRELCHLVADPFVTNAVFDLKGDGALAPFEDAVDVYHDGGGAKTMQALAEYLQWLTEKEFLRRGPIVKELSKAGLSPDVKVTREIARNAEYGLPLLVLTVDEAQVGINDATYGKRISAGLTRVAKEGRSFGVRVKIRTQDPDAKSVPTELNEMLPTRVAGRCEDWQVSKASLLTTRLRADLMPEGLEGGFYIRQPGNRYSKIIGSYVNADDAWAYVRKVIAHRQATGTLPGRAATAADDDRLLAAKVADLIRRDGFTVPAGRVMLARDVAVRLEIDQMALRAALGRIGIGTQKVWRADDSDATNRAHYVLTDFPSARAI